jgi:hypothetical protein
MPGPSSNLAQLWGPKRVREKVALLLRIAVPSPKALAQMYPASLGSPRIYLYYPVLWRDLLRRNGRSAWRLLRRDKAARDLAEQENRRAALREWLASDR